MIRVNLLSVDRGRQRKGMALTLGTSAQHLTIVCSVILVIAGGFCGWRYRKIWKESKDIDTQIWAAQQETSRLHSVIEQVQQFEQRKAQLQQRVVLIEQLRKRQTGPVHMLDQVSRALPQTMWLTALKQTGTDVLIDGRCTTLTELSDFVANLQATGYFNRSVEIISTQTESVPQPPAELITFSIKARFQPPETAAGNADPSAKLAATAP